jgi:hypothetical protein
MQHNGNFYEVYHVLMPHLSDAEGTSPRLRTLAANENSAWIAGSGGDYRCSQSCYTFVIT